MAFTMDAETAKIVSAGRRAWGELKKRDLWPHWVAVGRAIQAGRAAMMSYLRIDPSRNEPPSGRQWSEHFGAWLKETGFDEIDKGVRSRLEKCMDYLPEIEAWREDIGLTLRQQYNHPNTVWRHFSQKHGITAKRPRKEAVKGGPELALETQELNDQVRQLLAGEADLHFDLSSPETIDASADNFVALYGPVFGNDAVDAFADRLKEKAVARAQTGAEPQVDTAFAESLSRSRGAGGRPSRRASAHGTHRQ
jgi:hypothetical protein